MPRLSECGIKRYFLDAYSYRDRIHYDTAETASKESSAESILGSVAMNEGSRERYYVTGEEIHVGDRVLFGGHPATVVVVIGRGEFASGFVAEDWRDHERGILMRTDDGQMFMNEYADEDVQLVSRAAARC